MGKSAKQRANLKDQKLKRTVFIVSLLILVAKLTLVLSVKNGGWLGADGESYLKGVDALIKSGLSSKESVLVYWPAGYSIFIWAFSFISLTKLIYLISISQTILYFIASAFFVDRIRETRLSKYTMALTLVLGLNPTLSLSSLTVGYESLVASCMLASIAIIIRYEQEQKNRTDLFRALLGFGLIQSFSAFLQPRGLVIGFFMLFCWGTFHQSWKHFTTIVVLGTCIMMILPVALVIRNVSSGNGAVISRNLGVTMSLGAGDKATGGYGNTGGVPCPPIPPAAVTTDGQLVKCTLSWYFQHPRKGVILALKKSVYFWSPWYGPIANGTMARNPWLKIDPVRNMDTTRQGHNLVYGWFGKVISWIWLLSGLFLLFFGFRWLQRLGGLESQISVLVGVPVLTAWLTAVGTIGDHRFRLPTLGLSLFLQVVGYFGLRERLTRAQGPVN